MEPIKLTIPEGCKTVNIRMEDGRIITDFELEEEKFVPKDGDIIVYKFSKSNNNI